MALQPRKKINKKGILLLIVVLLLLGFCIFLIISSLTFLIKNINLVLKAPVQSSPEVHFNLEEAKKLFPNLTTASTESD